MSTRYAFEYSIIRVVPRVDREEFVNVGVIVFCDACNFLDARIELEEGRLLSLWPELDLTIVREHLKSFSLICAGGASAGPIGQLTLRERFSWLIAPRSTILQTSPSHGGLCEQPSASLDRLLAQLVRTPTQLG